LKSVFRELDILFCNEREILKIAGVQNADDAAERIAAAVPLLIVKRGPRGASLYANGLRMDAPAISVPVQDTVGAGDTFDAGFLYQWLREAPVEQCLAFANVAAALSTTRAGGVAAFKDSDYREKFLALHSPRAS
jgi:sugar/nucleoside kinase (ribokinase family)